MPRGSGRLQLNDRVSWGGEECFRLNWKFNQSLETFLTRWVSETPGDLLQMIVDTLWRPQRLQIVGIWGQQFG